MVLPFQILLYFFLFIESHLCLSSDETLTSLDTTQDSYSLNQLLGEHFYVNGIRVPLQEEGCSAPFDLTLLKPQFNSFLLPNNKLMQEYWKGQLTTLAVLIRPDMLDSESIHLASFGITLEVDLLTMITSNSFSGKTKLGELHGRTMLLIYEWKPLNKPIFSWCVRFVLNVPNENHEDELPEIPEERRKLEENKETYLPIFFLKEFSGTTMDGNTLIGLRPEPWRNTREVKDILLAKTLDMTDRIASIKKNLSIILKPIYAIGELEEEEEEKEEKEEKEEEEEEEEEGEEGEEGEGEGEGEEVFQGPPRAGERGISSTFEGDIEEEEVFQAPPRAGERGISSTFEGDIEEEEVFQGPPRPGERGKSNRFEDLIEEEVLQGIPRPREEKKRSIKHVSKEESHRNHVKQRSKATMPEEVKIEKPKVGKGKKQDEKDESFFEPFSPTLTSQRTDHSKQVPILRACILTRCDTSICFKNVNSFPCESKHQEEVHVLSKINENVDKKKDDVPQPTKAINKMPSEII
ncbi:hypothetical protein HMI54_001657 [Coelomomyces lativittatus]|nr:hypothetical protein HMI54_001657 [Coelomomyces lativittatus]